MYFPIKSYYHIYKLSKDPYFLMDKVKCIYNGTKVGKAKTNASFRKVDLTSEAKQIIEMVRNANKENGFKDEDFLFVNATQRMQENTILKRIYKFCDEAFIEKRSPHKVRKTFASILVNDGILDISEVAQLLGHVSEQTLINHYLYPTKILKQGEKDLKKHLQCNKKILGTLGNKMIKDKKIRKP